MSLKAAAKQRLLWAIRQVVSHYGRVILVCDARNLRIVSSACTQSEILDEGVDLVELVTKRRQPLKNRVALYLLDDCEDSVEEFLIDFTPGKEIYKSAFLMFNCHMLDDSNLRLVASSVDIERVLGCVEVYLNFVAYEDYVFHGNCFNLFKTFPTCSRSHVHGVASRLTSVISTLKMKPQIRYQNCAHGIASAVASSVVELLKASTNIVVADAAAVGQGDSSLTSSTSGAVEASDSSLVTTSGESDLVLILCRCLDPCCLFMHDYSYQALVYDVLDIGCCQSDAVAPGADKSAASAGNVGGIGATSATGKPDDVYEFTVVTNMGRQERRSALLSTDVDTFWLENRTLHVQDVNSKVMEQVDALGKFRADTGIGSSPGNVARDGDANNNGTSANVKDCKTSLTNPSKTIANTFDLVRNFPLMMVKLEKCWAHVKLTEACFAQIESRQLLKVGALEQVIVTNLDRHGKHHQSYSRNLQRLLGLLGDASIRLEERIRCILLFLHCYRNTSANDVQLLYDTANLDSKSKSACDWILALDLSITSPIGTKHNQDLVAVAASGVVGSGTSVDFKITHRLEGKCDAYYYYKHHFNDSDYDLDVYCPDVAHVLKRVEKDKLSTEHFPRVVAANSCANAKGTTRAGVGAAKVSGNRESLNYAALVDTDAIKGEAWNFGATSVAKSKPRLLLYILGGVTFAELRRVAGDLNAQYNVYIGGDSILVPKRIIYEATKMV